ncbi:SDR family NAD(P)-dependent oxidoreductase [Companilactobacillus kimchii]|uniref:SDR family oxidoreductase n=2 Tax=Companilactobacillus kimchii TaxID=2801452 RepID=A0ABR5NSU0_9LACO|nr:SDR family oxidoreductase [Companilactobacillus kimchii]KRK51252.1 hypothetical protein FC97_GL000943 [Companilactobacillus kimchii DSM 13961 = JCM 10707]
MLQSLTKSSTLEYAKDGIRINAVCPGIIETTMVTRMDKIERSEMDDLIREIPIGRLADPEEVVNIVLFLYSDAASYIIVRQAILVDGGYTIH